MSLKAIGEQAVVKPEKSPKTKIEIAIMVLLWSLLIYGFYDNYLRDWLD